MQLYEQLQITKPARTRSFCQNLFAAALGIAMLIGPPASAVELEWIRQFGTPESEAPGASEGHSEDGFGNVYIAGSTYGNLAATNAGNADVFLSKYDATGTQLWTRQIGSIQNDDAQGVSTDAAGNVYIAGRTGSHASNVGLFGPKDGGGDAFVAKYDGAGNQLWGRQFSVASAGDDNGNAVTVNHLGDVYVAGSTGFPPADLGVLLAKFDSDGNQMWARALDLTPNARDFASDIATDIHGNVYICGLSGAESYVAKYDSDGNQVWLRNPPDADDSNPPRGLVADGLGNVFISGSTSFSFVSHRDAFVTKYNADGVLQWSRLLGTPAADESRDVAVDGSGNLYISGFTGGNLDGFHPVGGATAFLAKYSAETGAHQWSLQFGNDSASGVSVDSSGIIYVSGNVAGDAFIAKFSDPIPEPNTFLLAALAFALVAVRRCRTAGRHGSCVDCR